MTTSQTFCFKYITRKPCKVKPRMILISELFQTLEHVDFVENGRGLGIIAVNPHRNLQRGIFIRPIFQVSKRRRYQNNFSGIRPFIPRKPNSRVGTIAKLRNYPISIIKNLANFDRVIIFFMIKWEGVLFDCLTVCCQRVSQSMDEGR